MTQQLLSILGVYLGLDGSNTTELAYRIQEATILAEFITQAHLSRVDAKIVYQDIWMASIRYCLPITRFTRLQCHKVTTIVEQEILPKIGFNWHNPKVVLYGPKTYGRKSLIHTHTEQLIMHTSSYMSHFDELKISQIII